jgi:ankyrin repeat protein
MTFDEADKAIKKDDVLCLRNELEHGLDANLSNRFGWTILMAVAMTGNTKIGEMLISKGASLSRRNKHGDTALSLAIQMGHPPFVSLLLKSGASLDCHPHGNSLDIFMDWVVQYCGVTRGTMAKIRAQIEIARGFNDHSSG